MNNYLTLMVLNCCKGDVHVAAIYTLVSFTIPIPAHIHYRRTYISLYFAHRTVYTLIRKIRA